MPSYATLEDVKRILRSSSRERIRFPSNGLKSIYASSRVSPSGAPLPHQQKNGNNVYNPTYQLLFNSSFVEIAPTFKGRVLLSINFTSPTNFSVYHQSEINGEHDKREMLIGTGNITTDFVYMGEITILAGAWGGVIAAGDTLKLEFEVDMNDEDAEFFIENAEIDIDNMLSANSVDYLEPGYTRLFLAPDIPPAVQMATQYLAAYYIFTAAYHGEMQENTGGVHFSKDWKVRAHSVLANYISHAKRIAPSAVQAYSDFGARALVLAKEWHNPEIIECCDLTFYDSGHIEENDLGE